MKSTIKLTGISWMIAGVIAAMVSPELQAQYVKPGNDASSPLHLMKPNYPVPYEMPSKEKLQKIADLVFNYLDATTPYQLIDKRTGFEPKNLEMPDTNISIKTGDYRLTSYEWGVTYAGMLRLSEATGDKKFADYTQNRVKFLATVTPYFIKMQQSFPSFRNPLKQVIAPHALDDAGAVCAAIIKSVNGEKNSTLQPLIDRYMDFISNKEFRFADKTLARNRPLPNTMWLDDLYMSVPALSQMGKHSNNNMYFDDATRQVLQFSERMFNTSKGLYMHGWVQGMEPHPQFHWARANGWAIMAMSELLDVLPASHPDYQKILAQFKLHAQGIVSYQSGSGFWHQLLDRTDSYLETSATAIYSYCLAHGINQGWLDAKAFGPAAILAWNAVSTKVNDKGEVEGTCVGTGMGFDPAFYYHRPVSVFAAHGYGPVLLATAEIMILSKSKKYRLNDSALTLSEN